jgi:hypothetical protein
VIVGQPLAQARRQHQLLLAVTRKEVLRHPGILLITPDRPRLCATATVASGSRAPAAV